MTEAVATASLTDRLAARLQLAVDEHARRRAALLLVDWLGCVLGASRLPLARSLRQLRADLPRGRCSTFGSGLRDPASALLLNAALGNGLEMDDVERLAILHPGPVVIPVALACVQHYGGSADDLLDAVVRGYEATIRVGRSLGRGHYRYWHTTSTAGAFGAAAAAASVLQLDVGACADAMGTAGSRTGGLWQMRHEDVLTKSIHNSEAARSGLTAALLARPGVAGPREVLEGPQGLYAATAPDAQPQAMLAASDDWLIHQTSLKPWAACRHAHPAIDALRRLLPIAAGAVASIEVETYGEALRFCDRPAPRTELDARFSLQHAMASVLLRGDPLPQHFAVEALQAPDLAALRARVLLREDAELEAAFPAHYGARVRIHLRGGGSREVLSRDAWGDPECPMGDADVLAKAMSLAEWGGQPCDVAATLFAAALALADNRDPGHFFAALAPFAGDPA